MIPTGRRHVGVVFLEEAFVAILYAVQRIRAVDAGDVVAVGVLDHGELLRTPHEQHARQNSKENMLDPVGHGVSRW